MANQADNNDIKRFAGNLMHSYVHDDKLKKLYFLMNLADPNQL